MVQFTDFFQLCLCDPHLHFPFIFQDTDIVITSLYSSENVWACCYRATVKGSDTCLNQNKKEEHTPTIVCSPRRLRHFQRFTYCSRKYVNEHTTKCQKTKTTKQTKYTYTKGKNLTNSVHKVWWFVLHFEKEEGSGRICIRRMVYSLIFPIVHLYEIHVSLKKWYLEWHVPF